MKLEAARQLTIIAAGDVAPKQSELLSQPAWDKTAKAEEATRTAHKMIGDGKDGQDAAAKAHWEAGNAHSDASQKCGGLKTPAGRLHIEQAAKHFSQAAILPQSTQRADLTVRFTCRS